MVRWFGRRVVEWNQIKWGITRRFRGFRPATDPTIDLDKLLNRLAKGFELLHVWELLLVDLVNNLAPVDSPSAVDGPCAWQAPPAVGGIGVIGANRSDHNASDGVPL